MMGKRTLVAFSTICVFLWPILAIAREAPYNTFINTNTSAQFAANAFGRGGFFFLAGGVVLHGQAQFYLDDGQGKRNVPAADVTFSIPKSQSVYLHYRDDKFRLQAHKRIACQLGRFVARDGLIAYTIPPDTPDNLTEVQSTRLKEAGLVEIETGFIANEFYKTPLARLVRIADFGDTAELPDELKHSLINGINEALGSNRHLDEDVDGSYLNTDHQVTYQVYLVTKSHRVEVGGVPLRYYWDWATDGSGIVSDVRAMSTDWPDGSKLSDLSDSANRLSQYDVVALYQTAGVLRQLSVSNPEQFKSVLATACAN
jgi:hypothetical protein